MAGKRFRIIDTDGSEVAVVALEVEALDEGDELAVPELGAVVVVEVYDDEDGREGDVTATVVVERS